ncbi:germ cell nuclear acidic protein [Mixophyes fleayi]|uniref:germ cell nuclear acidic protein n=1 Tax=Mixophyes fleayi TaxID=3061075 RepID=UPI003F4DA67B
MRFIKFLEALPCSAGSLNCLCARSRLNAIMAAESRSLLERISARLTGTRPSQSGQKPLPGAQDVLSPDYEEGYSPQLAPCVQELVLTDSELDTSLERRAGEPDHTSALTNTHFSFILNKPRSTVAISDSSDEEFEHFLTQLKTPKPALSKGLDKQGNSLRGFIVDSDDDFASVLSKSVKAAKRKNGVKTSETGPAGPLKNRPGMQWDSPVFVSDSDDDSIVIKSTWRERHKTNRKDYGQKLKSQSKNDKENCYEPPSDKCSGTQETGERPAVRSLCTPGSSDEEFECLMDRIKNRTKPQTPGSTASKVRPKTAVTEPTKVPCIDLTNKKAKQKTKSQTDVSSPYFSIDEVLKEPLDYIEGPAAESMRCKVPDCFLQGLSCPTSLYVKNFKQKKHELTARLYKLYNGTIFEQKLPDNLEILWNKKMRKTAGYCVTGQKNLPSLHRYARIELSEKVCDSADRLRDTLIHEVCHAATWLINGVRDGHGQYWRFYARKATLLHPELPMVTRCHTYEINYKFTYECSRCRNTIGRHSKSLDTDKFVCALCKGKLTLLTPTGKDGTPSCNRITPFAKFVKDNYGSTKKEMIGMSHAEVMRKLSADFSTKTKICN